MADYYSVLKKTIAGLQENTGSARRAVYQRARKAIAKQLKNYDPPLSPSQITEEQLRLEECIRKVEAEAARETLGLPAKEADANSQRYEAIKAAYINEKQNLPTQDAAAKPVANKQDGVAEGQEVPVGSDVASSNGDDVFKQAVAAAETLGEAAGATESPQTTAPADAANNEVAQDAKQAAWKKFVKKEEKWVPGQKTNQRDNNQKLEAKETPDTNGRRRRADPRLDKLDEEMAQEPAYGYMNEGLQPSKGPQVAGFGIVALIAVVVVAGVFYFQKDDLAKLFSRSGSDNTQVVTKDSSQGAATSSGSKKREDRLLGGASHQADEVRNVSSSTVTSQSEIASTDLAENGQVQPVNSAQVTNSVPTANNLQASNPLPEQSEASFLYEEGADNKLAVRKGNVVWRLEKDASGVASVIAKAQVPDRGITVTMSLKPNSDSSLPASHLLELTFELPEGFDGQGIAKVPALVLKASEEASGDPLNGAAVQVSQDLFWIALSDLKEELNANMQLLKEREWVDVPLLYANGKRATLTFQKGESGQRVIEEAMQTW
ncbi:hypothetical protein [Polycladidibacter stylochi]|uniref:hypothetical protein n=1 Tax=Polycladidibacter stylochi TaxID=1807766 RepID=UPI00082C2052|nr:hypothetical protein [Pseudovibrio stylochi]